MSWGWIIFIICLVLFYGFFFRACKVIGSINKKHDEEWAKKYGSDLDMDI